MTAAPAKRPPLDILIVDDGGGSCREFVEWLTSDDLQPWLVSIEELDLEQVRGVDLVMLPATAAGLELLPALTAHDLPPALLHGEDLSALEDGLAQGASDFLCLPSTAAHARCRVRACLTRGRATGHGGIDGLADALAALAARDQLVRRIVHDLNNPLTNVLGTADLLLMQARQATDVTPRQLRRLTSLRSSAEDLATLIQGVHELNLLSRGERRSSLSDQDARALVKEGLDTFGRTFGDTSELIGVEMPESVKVRADRSLLPSVVLHLVNHSVKRLGKAGKIELELSARDEQIAHLTLSMPGVTLKPIEESVLGVAGAEGDAAALSLGIRLAYCKLAMAAQGGALRAVNAAAGAQFILELPRA